MGVPDEPGVSAPDIEVSPSPPVNKTQFEKDDADVEAASVNEPPKGSYSKLSVWLMVLFSGLAIGSDG